MSKKISEEPKIATTGDGSNTLYSHQFEQHYHSTRGAVTESNHLFFEKNGLKKALKTKPHINILEVGFGTSLNLLLLLDNYVAAASSANIDYNSIEAHPISVSTFKKLNYGPFLSRPELAKQILPAFDDLTTGCHTFQFISSVNVCLFYDLFEDYKQGDQSFDFIFHDAFSPLANPNLWTSEVFKKILKWSAPDAILTTYCAASKARGAMAAAGWKVARDEGAPGKREMTVASPTAEPLSHLKRINEERLARRYEQKDF